MFTTGFKLFFGLFGAFVLAALAYGYSTGGDGVGPLSLGWKGGVGDHIGYTLLVALAAVSLTISVVLVSYRDADADAQARLRQLAEVPADSAVTASVWPVLASFGVGAAVLGLVLHPLVFTLGLALVALSLIEWTMDAWADSATGDAAANRELRNRIMAPIEIPVIGALAIGVVVLAASRIFLNVSQLQAVAAAGVVSSLILAGAWLYVARPGQGRRLVRVLGAVAALGLLVGGVLAAVAGERDFEHHHGDDHHEEHQESSSEPTGGAGSG
ncbi:MAG: hypothetical protein OXE79_05680 [Acidimicrobiaceae bacterium]|nr:hypothetical protein [Acidimicrobiaceae bacterium]MCY4176231.1 hypothetical protein [Acidimicrobiaceae bacterium]MCY4280211.1 hypothetical protein [Acidimicrobiaceae bacterium]MCY4293607.1 hypothetical protein [Acidimicrobiaceae bacterium]